jgi:chaperonin cofactor prefoldin
MTLFKHDINANVKKAFMYLEEIDDDGTFNFQEVFDIGEKYPYIFYPLYQLQTHIITKTLGEYWWETHKANVHDQINEDRAKEIAMIQKKQKDAQQAMETMNEDIVKKRMGITYYLLPFLRKKERAKIAKIAAIEGELEQQFNDHKKAKPAY